MLRLAYTHYVLDFKRPSQTSRETLTRKETFFIKAWDTERPGRHGVGECALFRGLSAEDTPDFEETLQQVCQQGEAVDPARLARWSSIRFGIETALASLSAEKEGIIFPSPFTEGKESIAINGLIWMGPKTFMLEQIKEKLAAGFHCIKLKIGGIDFESELDLLRYIRTHFPKEVIEIRVDANGAFSPREAMHKLEQLAPFALHSIEQPIRAGQYKEMAELCRHSPVPIALDEELIHHFSPEERSELVERLRPQYLVIKPSLHGGIAGTREWIEAASQIDAGWWITSALESNVGLNAIAQFTATLNPRIPQGLGTGALYTNNIPSPLYLEGDQLRFNPTQQLNTKVLPNT